MQIMKDISLRIALPVYKDEQCMLTTRLQFFLSYTVRLNIIELISMKYCTHVGLPYANYD